MTSQEENDMPAPETGAADEEQKTIVDAKAALGETQAKTVAGRPEGGVTAERSTGVNAASEEPIDPRMPEMPPA